MKRLATGICLAVCLACGACTEDSPPGTSSPVTVRVLPVVRQEVERRLDVVGSVEASASVEIRPRVTGELVAVHVQEGQEVHQGDPLMTLDTRPYAAALREARALLARDQARLVKAEEDRRRYGTLAKEEFVSREAYEKAATDAAELRASVQADQAAVERAALQLSYCAIVAPITGRAGSLQVDRGNMVKEGESQTLLTIDALEPIHVTFAVPEGHLSAIRARMAAGDSPPVQVMLPTGVAVDGKVDFMENRVDTRTGTIRLRAVFANRDRLLWPGQFVQVRLELDRPAPALVIPVRCLQRGREENYVYVVGPDKTARYRAVRVAFQLDDRCIVASGLNEGELVIAEGLIRVAPGVPVQVQQAQTLP